MKRLLSYTTVARLPIGAKQRKDGRGGSPLQNLGRIVAATLLITFLASSLNTQQPAAQNPSPMIEHTRPHQRVKQADVAGRRVELSTLKGARLFLGPRFNPNRPIPLLIHFHGAAWLLEAHMSHLPSDALITVQLGAGSNAYRKPFEQPDLFRRLINEAEKEAGLKRGWSSITLSGFSAGYGAVREILRRPEYFAIVNNVLLLDGMHTSYVPEGKTLADGGTLDQTGLDSFLAFAKAAVAGQKVFVFTHSEIFPGTYASTTECADYLITQLNVKLRPELRTGPLGMQQLSAVDVKGLHIRGFAGNTAPDHVDHLHAMVAWFRLLALR